MEMREDMDAMIKALTSLELKVARHLYVAHTCRSALGAAVSQWQATCANPGQIEAVIRQSAQLAHRIREEHVRSRLIA